MLALLLSPLLMLVLMLVLVLVLVLMHLLLLLPFRSTFIAAPIETSSTNQPL